MMGIVHLLHSLPPLITFLLLILAPAALSQPADPNNPSTWSITSCILTNLTASNQSLTLTTNLAPLSLLYLVLPSSTTSSSLYFLNPNNPTYTPTTTTLPPTSTADYLASYSTATNVSDPMYMNNTVIVAGVVDATEGSSIELTMYLPPSSVFTIYYLLANTSADPPLYGEPLTSPASTNVSVPAACVAPPTLSYCANLAPTTLYPSNLDPYTLDTTALTLYTADLALYNPSTDCSQQANASLCSDCLAIRQRWRCATVWNGCSSTAGGSTVVGGGGYGGPCQWLCVEKNSRCGEVEDCSVYSNFYCNGAWSFMVGGGGVWMWLMLALLGAVLPWLS